MGRVNDWQEMSIAFFREMIKDKHYNIKRRGLAKPIVYFRESFNDRFPKRVVVNITGSFPPTVDLVDVIENLDKPAVALGISVHYSVHYDCYEMAFSAPRISQYL